MFAELINDKDNLSVMIGFVCVCLLVMQLDTQHLILAGIGACTYALLQLKLRREQRTPTKKVCSVYDDDHHTWRRSDQRSQRQPRQQPQQPKQKNPNPSIGVRPDLKPLQPFAPPAQTPSAQPLSAPVFQATGWDSEVKELLTQIKPTKTSEENVQKLVEIAKKAICQLIPEAEVFGFALGDISRGTAFGVAVPEVELLVRCSPEKLFQHLHLRLQNREPKAMLLDERKIQKSAIRACTDLLVNVGFKFRRSAFRGEEPKVTLLAPVTLGISDKAVPVDFSVNSITPVYNSALMQVAAALDSRVLELGLLVKRWAKDRGVCHAAKAHLSPYAWNLLCVFFLQCLGDKEGKDGVLPAFDKLDWSGCPIGNKKACVSNEQESSWVTPKEYDGMEAPELLKEFFRFYRYNVDWSKEGVSLHRARRGSLPRRMKTAVIQPDPTDASVYIPEYTFGDPSVALAIEDPWERTRNLSSDLTYFALCRLKEELCRACNLCEENASLSKLLDPWVPPEKNDEECPEEKNGKNRATAEKEKLAATAELLNNLHTNDSPAQREKKTRELVTLLKDDKKLSQMIANKL